MKKLNMLAALTLAFTLNPAVAVTKAPIEAKWLVAHNAENEPVLDLLKDFATTIERKTKGKLRISIVPTPRSGFTDAHLKAYEDVARGDYQLSQISIRGLAQVAPNLQVLDLPFLFSSYSHSVKVFDGKIGANLKNSLLAQSKSKVRGIEFTYSGGFRKLFATDPVRNLESLRSMMVQFTDAAPNGELSSRTPAGRFFSDLGMKGCDFKKHRQCAKEGMVIERELNRFAVLRKMRPEMRQGINTVIDTDHSLFLTLMVANEAFLNSLPDPIRHTLVSELHKLARAERELSVKLEQENRARLAAEGVRFVQLPPRDQMLMELAGQKTQNHFKAYAETIQAIKGIKVKGTERLLGKVKDHTLAR